MNAGRSLCDLFRSGALGMRQLDGYAGKMTNALMAAHQQIDGVFGGLRLQGSERGNLIQHVTLLWRRKAGGEKAVASSRSSVAKLPVASFYRQLTTTDNWPCLLYTSDAADA